MRPGPWVFLLVASVFLVVGLWDAADEYLLADALWGGDSYAQLGIANSIYSGNPPWEDAAFQGEWAFRDWLPFLLLAGAARLTGSDPHTVARFWPVVVMFLGGIVVYFLGRRLLRSEPWAIALGVAWMGMEATLLPTSRYFAAMLTVPLAVLALASVDRRAWTRALAGLAFGAASLSYIVAFFGVALLLVFSSVYRVLPRRIVDGPAVAARAGDWRARLRGELRWVAPIWLSAAPVILLLWGPILAVYGGEALNPSHLYGDAARGWTLRQAWEPVRGLFFDGTSPFHLVLGLLALGGVRAAFAQWDSRGGKWALLVTGVGLAGTYHYLLSLPLFGDHLVYYRWPTVFLRLAQALLAFQFVAWVASRRMPGFGRAWQPVVGAAVALVVVGGSVAGAGRDVNPEWKAAARDVLATRDMQATLEAANWTLANTSREDVFLAMPMDSFALNALTGRKLVVERRPHANAFVDMDQRYADAAIMLFGQNASEQRALMEQYSVDYVLIGPLFSAWLERDPLLTSPDHAARWDAAGITYERTRRPYDPVGDSQLFDVIVPTNVTYGPALLQLEVLWAAPGDTGDAFMLAVHERP